MSQYIKFKKIETAEDFALFRDSLISNDEYDQQSEKDRFKSIQDANQYVENRLRTFFHDCVLLFNENEDSIGYAYSYDYRSYDNHCKICVRMRADYNADYMVLADVIARFADRLFKYYPINKIFSEVCSSDTLLNAAFKTAGFTEEVVLPEHLFLKGEYYSMSILGLMRGKNDAELLSNP